MLIFKRLTLQNFLSIGADPQTIVFDDASLTLVLGENHDAVGNGSRNGAGKTTALQGLSFALFGKPLTKIKNGNLVNNVNEKNALVSLDFERDGRAYRIERGLKPTLLRFFVEDEEMEARDEAQGENRRTQEEIDRVLDGMSHLLFKYVIALNTYADPILKMSAAEQRALIEELFGATQMSRRADALRDLIKLARGDLRNEETRFTVTEQANARIENAIIKARGELALWDRLQTRRIAELRTDLDAYAAIDFEAELAALDAAESYVTQAADLKRAVAAAQSRMDGLARSLTLRQQALRKLQADEQAINPETEIARFDADIARKTREAERYARDAQTAAAEAADLQAQIDSPQAGSCERCGQELTSEAHLADAVRKLTLRLRAATAKAEQEATRAAEMRADITLIDVARSGAAHRADQQLKAVATQITAAQADLDAETLELSEATAERDDAKAALASLGAPPTPIFKSRDQLYETKQAVAAIAADLERAVEEANPHAAQVAQLEATLQPLDPAPVEALRDLLKHQEFLLKLLTHKESFIRKRIIEQNLPYLNSCVNGYLHTLGLPHAVDFQPDLTVEITKLGKEFDFEQMSRGEMNRIVIATCLAFRDVWENLNTSVNLMCVDELIDFGMCDAGAEASLGVLKQMAHERGKNVFLISHKDNLRSRVASILMVKKVDDFTKFEVEAV